MITLTIVEKAKTGKVESYKRKMKLYRSMDKCRKELHPIVTEMKLARKQKREPSIKVDAVSYDTNSEKRMLLELGAIASIENESDNY